MKNYYPYPKRDAVKNYFPLPNEIFTLGLSAGEIAVYAYLLYRCVFSLLVPANKPLGTVFSFSDIFIFSIIEFIPRNIPIVIIIFGFVSPVIGITRSKFIPILINH